MHPVCSEWRGRALLALKFRGFKGQVSAGGADPALSQASRQAPRGSASFFMQVVTHMDSTPFPLSYRLKY